MSSCCVAVICCSRDLESKNLNDLALIPPPLARARGPSRFAAGRGKLAVFLMPAGSRNPRRASIVRDLDEVLVGVADINRLDRADGTGPRSGSSHDRHAALFEMCPHL